MNYSETVEFLYSNLPVFQKSGAKAIKPKLTNIIKLCDYLGNPELMFKSIHVGGTNGKGSSSHFLASILQEAGYKTGLYTSPHLKDFRERFRINGKTVSENYVVNFIQANLEFIKEIQPSFFELTVALAFKYFADEKVDIAVIEVGLGGRFDSTNIINPILSLITNIGYDHMDVLGDTLEKIAFEKAGIIKSGFPVVISEILPETEAVFNNASELNNSRLSSAQKKYSILRVNENEEYLDLSINNNRTNQQIQVLSGLLGEYQKANIIGVLAAVDELTNIGFEITNENIQSGFKNVITNTNLKGRWQILSKNPMIICDTGHNEHGLKITTDKIKNITKDQLHLILGFVKDKDVAKVLALFPSDAFFYLCEFDSIRSTSINELKAFAEKFNLNAKYFQNVNEAIVNAKTLAQTNDLIFIGGSTYLVAEINDL